MRSLTTRFSSSDGGGGSGGSGKGGGADWCTVCVAVCVFQKPNHVQI